MHIHSNASSESIANASFKRSCVSPILCHWFSYFGYGSIPKSTMMTGNNATLVSSAWSNCIVEKCLVNIGSSVTIPQHHQHFFDIFFWVNLSLIFAIGAPMSFSIVHYEWFGGDPQKRSLVNRFMSSLAMSSYTASLFIQACVGAIRYPKSAILKLFSINSS